MEGPCTYFSWVPNLNLAVGVYRCRHRMELTIQDSPRNLVYTLRVGRRVHVQSGYFATAIDRMGI